MRDRGDSFILNVRLVQNKCDGMHSSKQDPELRVQVRFFGSDRAAFWVCPFVTEAFPSLGHIIRRLWRSSCS